MQSCGNSKPRNRLLLEGIFCIFPVTVTLWSLFTRCDRWTEEHVE